MKRLLKYSFIALSLFLCCKPKDSPTDEFTYFSHVLQRKVKYLVLLPPDYAPQKQRYPVLYLLHCAGCTHYSYIEHYPLPKIHDFLKFIIIIPFDGTTTGWWLDSPVDTLSQLSTWLSGEFKALIDSQYATLPDRDNTGIAGHSMGGYGALLNYINHCDIYGYAFSAKGLLNIIGHKGEFGASGVLGRFASHETLYEDVDLFSLANRLKGKNTSIRFYSGPSDWFTEENRCFDSLLTILKLRHSYFENEEPHPSMSLQSTWKMIRYFDSCFTGVYNR